MPRSERRVSTEYNVRNAPVDRALHISSGEQAQRIARVDGQSPVLWLHPLPLSCLVTANLQRGNRLPEEQGERTEIGMAPPPKTQLRILLRREFAVFHVSEMILRGVRTTSVGRLLLS